jgi:hypothetical protein
MGYRFRFKNKAFILAITDVKCEECCYQEPFLKELKDELDSGNYGFLGDLNDRQTGRSEQSVQIARMDKSDVEDLKGTDQIHFHDLPAIFVVK